MNSTERVRNTILGKLTDRQPIYGWVEANLSEQLTEAYGSVAAFEDRYEFDMAHIFGGPGAFREDVIQKLRVGNEELTPDLLLEADIFTSPDQSEAYENPVQLSAAGMDAVSLKENWGGGLVFNTVHNIQANVPVENIVAMFRAVSDFRSSER